MRIVLNHKAKLKLLEDSLNELSMVKGYLNSKKLQEYIEFEDVIYQLQCSVKSLQKLYRELNYLYERLDRK